MTKITYPLCPRCGERPKLLESYCRPCRKEYRRERYQANHADNKRQVRIDAWKRQGINLTWEEYESLISDQDGLCAICEGPPGARALHVDHNHDTGQVRALLCSNCNVALGAAQDNPELLHKMILYLEQHHSVPNNLGVLAHG